MSDLTLKERTTAAQTALQFQAVSQTGRYDFLTSDGRIEAHLDEEGSLILGTGELAKNFGKWVIKTRGQFGTIEQYNDEDETWFYSDHSLEYLMRGEISDLICTAFLPTRKSRGKEVK